MSLISKKTKTAIVLFNLGGPDKAESVQPFLFNLFNDKAIIGLPNPMRFLLAKLISKKRAPIAQEIYGEIGGKSPILENTQDQAQALKGLLSVHGEVETFICMRYWHPMSEEAVAQVKDYAPDNIILMTLYPQFSTTTTGSSVNEWKKIAKKQKLNIPTTTLCCFPTEHGWIHATAKMISEHLEKSEHKDTMRLLFSAHGLPEKIIKKGDPYQWQVEQTTLAVVEELKRMGVHMNPTKEQLSIDGNHVDDSHDSQIEYMNCYQSRVGPLKWIGPSTEDEIERAGKENQPIMLIPIAFVSEHSETLVELDIEYREVADEHNVPEYVRVPTVSAHPDFIAALADMCLALDGEKKLCSNQGGRICPKNWKNCPHGKKRRN